MADAAQMGSGSTVSADSRPSDINATQELSVH